MDIRAQTDRPIYSRLQKASENDAMFGPRGNIIIVHLSNVDLPNYYK